jgi:exonuclease III
MKILFWNIIGLGGAGRRKMLIELVNKHNFDCICLQETIKSNFRQRDLDRFAGTKDMFWSWVPCSGHSGGMLMGVDKELATVTAENKGVFFQSCTMTMKEDGFSWTLMNIYGPAHDDRKLEFLEEIQNEILDLDLPIVLGGDFNLVRKVEEKSSGNVDVHLMDAFNDMINNSNLRESFRSGSRYTWSNKRNPQSCVFLIEFWFLLLGKTDSI